MTRNARTRRPPPCVPAHAVLLHKDGTRDIIPWNGGHTVWSEDLSRIYRIDESFPGSQWVYVEQ